MRVALISYEFPPDTLGGIGTYARHLVTLLTSRGHDVTVFAGTPATVASSENFLGARVRRLSCADRSVFSQVAVPALLAEHARAAFDVAEVPDLYAEGAGLRAGAPALPIVLRAHTPIYVAGKIHFYVLPPLARRLSALRRLLGGLLHRQPWRPTWRDALARVHYRNHYNPAVDPERQVALEADLVAPPSQRLAARLRDDWQLPSDRVSVVPYAHLSAADLLALPPASAARTVAFHGGVRLFKGVHILVAAMPRILARHPDVRFILAGASATSPVPDYSLRAWCADRMIAWRETTEWLRPQIAALGDRVILRGFVRPENLITHLADADVCVFPSLFDNFPSACLEAMSAARAIVATRSGGMEEMLGDDGGLLVPPGDATALADAICRLLDDAGLRLRLALRAREHILTRYSAGVIGPLHEALYARAITRRREACPRVTPS